MKKAIVLFAALLLLAGGGAAIALAIRMQRDTQTKTGAQAGRTTPIATGEFLKGYELTERSGAKFNSKSLAGKVHIVNFFFATCPARCPLQTKSIHTLQDLLQEKKITADQALLLSITVDPKQDTPQVLRDYADKYGADKDQWLFLTGDPDYLQRVAGEIYQVTYERQTHVEKIILVDKWGQIRGLYRWYDPTDFAILQRQLVKLLEETEKPNLTPSPHEEVAGEKEAREEEELERAQLEKQKREKLSEAAVPQ